MKRNDMLVVDDQIVNRIILSKIFKKKYHVIEAVNGKDAIEKIKEHQDSLAVILLDVIMPVLDGFGVLKFIKENQLDDIIPVVMITADSSNETEMKGYDYKVADILPKPFRVNVVERRVKNIVELYSHKTKLEHTVEQQMQKLEESYDQLQQKNQELEETQDSLTEALSNIVEFRNNESGGHVRRIKKYTEILAYYIMQEYPKYGLTPEIISKIVKASALHDIGKISISDTILLKPGRLTNEEFEKMKEHTVIGCALLKQFNFIKDKEFYDYSCDICRHHHERYDGKGYPDGLGGDEISIASQIVSVADVYDALISERCYKKAFTKEKATEMILGGECGAFGEDVLHCFALARQEIG